MEFGIGYFPTHDAVGPGELARLVEERGHESLFFAEHTHIPASRETPVPGGGELPRKYWHTYDLFVALTAAAVATSRLRVGSGICLVIERDPIITAKEVASIDHLSGGRFEFGVGAGWNREEMGNHGTDPRTRMRADGRAGRGDEGDLDRGRGELPRRVRRLRAHLVLAQARCSGRTRRSSSAATAPTVLDRVLAFGDAWLPNYAGEDLLARIAELRARAERPIDAHGDGLPADPAALERCARRAAARVVHWLPSAHTGGGRAALERWERAIAELNGEA